MAVGGSRNYLGYPKGQAVDVVQALWVMFDFPSDGRNEGDHAGIETTRV